MIFFLSAKPSQPEPTPVVSVPELATTVAEIITTTAALTNAQAVTTGNLRK